MNFIYVMSSEDKAKMITLGYELLKENNGVFVFANKDTVNFSNHTELEEAHISHVLSNVLTF